jgi:thymidylate synthase ThyX
MIKVEIVADSIGATGNRLTSYVLTYPRFIHSEVMTHRMFSRNAASSRAIPVQKMIERIKTEPAGPIQWGKNQKGMQANELLDAQAVSSAQTTWLDAMKSAVKQAEILLELGVHKQIANRLLEPFAHMTTIVTATDFANFFNLRAHPDAQPEFQELAYQMLLAYKLSKPIYKTFGGWHLPFSDKYLPENLSIKELLKITTARAARVSYLNFEGDIAHDKDYKLHDDLSLSGHWSPFEHAAQCKRGNKYYGNFKGWKQYRKFFSEENRTKLDIEEILNKRGHK